MQEQAASDEQKTAKIQLRVTEFQKNRIRSLAKKHAPDGSMSAWIIEQSTRIPGAQRVGSNPQKKSGGKPRSKR